MKLLSKMVKAEPSDRVKVAGLPGVVIHIEVGTSHVLYAIRYMVDGIPNVDNFFDFEFELDEYANQGV